VLFVVCFLLLVGMRSSRGGRGRGGRGGRGAGRGAGNQGFGRGKSFPVRSSSDAERAAREKFRKEQAERAQAKGGGGMKRQESDDNTCLVCCEESRVVSVGACDHAVCCALCTVRMRELLNDTRCVLCKTDLDKVFLTSNKSKKFDSFQTYGEIGGPGLISDSHGMFFEQADGGKEEKDRIDGLKLLRCNADGCNQQEPFQTFQKLNSHLMEAHGLRICPMCWESRGVFPMEQTLYTKAAYDRHCQKGEDNTAFVGHPMCKFCKTRFYNEDALYYHLKQKHENCHVCRKEGRMHEYYRDYKNLYKHFEKAHFVCTDPECKELKFIVFPTEFELRGHMVSNHPNVRVDRSVPTNFKSYRDTESASGGDQGGIDSFDFHYQPERDRSVSPALRMEPANHSVAGGVLESAEAFPGLGELNRPVTPPGVASHYSSALGAGGVSTMGGGLNDLGAFPTLGGGSKSYSQQNSGGAFGFAAAAGANRGQPKSSSGVVIKSKKKKKGGRHEEQPKQQWKSREQEQLDMIKSNTMQQRGFVPPPAPRTSVQNQDLAMKRAVKLVKEKISADQFREFQNMCGLYRSGQITPQAFYGEMGRMFSRQDFNQVLPLLVESLPDRNRAKALADLHAKMFAKPTPQPVPAPTPVTTHAQTGWGATAVPQAAPTAKLAGDNFPSLPKKTQAADRAMSSTDKWDAFQKSSKLKTNVSLGTKKKKATKKKNDALFFYGGR